ncbi:MAG: N-6 DNA methylase [Pyramidobacter sp.]|nr:N-6 DNA methylase [Pyramidobacter sp.]
MRRHPRAENAQSPAAATGRLSGQTRLAHLLRPRLRQRQLPHRDLPVTARHRKRSAARTAQRRRRNGRHAPGRHQSEHQPVLRHRDQRLCRRRRQDRPLDRRIPDDERHREHHRRQTRLSAPQDQRQHRRRQRPETGLGPYRPARKAELYHGESALITNSQNCVLGTWGTKTNTQRKLHSKRTICGVAPGLPKISDGQQLFVLNGLAKLDPKGKMAIIQNGSPLFSGDAGSGPSEIRRYMLENDWLDAIVQLPTDMFIISRITDTE